MKEISRYKKFPIVAPVFHASALDHIISTGLGIWVATSMYSMFWLTDDFDVTRNTVAIICGLPAIVSAITMDLWFKQIWLEWRKTRITIQLIIFFGFAWGNFSLLNAMGTPEHVVVSRNYGESTMTEPQFLGAFGVLFKMRW